MSRWSARQEAIVAGAVVLLVLSYAGSDSSATVVWLVAMPAMTMSGAIIGYFLGSSWRAVGVCVVIAFGCQAALMIWGTAEGPDLVWWSMPGFVGGVAFRRRRELAAELAERVQEVTAEQALFTELSVRNERAQISAELHDIIGHAISVMVVQAAAGQRLADVDPELASQALTTIAASARQGRDDLRRLVDVLGGREVETPDLSVIEAIAEHAARACLDVSCRFEGERDGVPAPVAQTAVRIVQEGITNALRHAPGSRVDVLVRGEPYRRGLTVEITNGPPGAAMTRPVVGTGNGLRGVRERVDAVGGTLSAGPTEAGGWRLIARLALV